MKLRCADHGRSEYSVLSTMDEVLSTLLLACFICFLSAPHAAAEAPAHPRLAVLIVFDQMRGDYPTRWQELYGEGGFRRLQAEAAWYENCHYPYAHTVTAAGHASLSTGTVPRIHGIVSNEWFDRTSGETVLAAGSNRYSRVPAGESTKQSASAAPDRLLVPGLGDALKKGTNGKGRVVSLSFKDRSAVLLAGHQADACYWLDGSAFVTSTYYRDQPHPWVAAFNQEHVVDRWFGKPWTRLRPNLDYERYSGPDDVVGEGTGAGQGRTFPHPMSAAGLTKPDKEYYKALYNSPFGNELLLELAKRALDAEQLGKHDVPDLLCISFSCNDPIGHIWGPDSQEVLDVTLRTDRLIKDLLDTLDAKVGKGNYVLAMSADHGICPLPEVSRAKGREAGRILPGDLRKAAARFLNERFGPNEGNADWFEKTEPADLAVYPWVYLNHATLNHRGLDLTVVEEALAGWLRKQTGIQEVFTGARLASQTAPQDALERLVYNSYRADRSGDLALVLKPYYVCTSFLTGTTHGEAHDYDTHVPLFLYGPGIKPGVHAERVAPQLAPVVLMRTLGITTRDARDNND